jgi:catechol 2,3-dioxygenase-like lactoylglutathione lyase family enzyme
MDFYKGGRGMLTRLWTIGMKVVDLDQELDFHRKIGNEIVLDEAIQTEGGKFRLPLVKMGDRFLHLMEETVYEKGLDKPLPVGPAHLVYVSDDWASDVARAISAGGRKLIEPVQIKAGFGERKLTFIQAPGGWNFEIFQVIRDFVPDVPAYKSRLKGLWTCGIKVPDIARELEFHRKLGNEIVLDETIEAHGQKFRLPLVRMSDKYIHVLDKAVYEDDLGETIPYGICHLVYVSTNFEEDVEICKKAGARPVGEIAHITAQFGERLVAFFRAPGGWNFEILKMIRNLVPEVV